MADRSGYIGRAPGDSTVTIARQTYSPTGVQTSFTFTSGYTPSLLDVYVNGSRLIDISDYAATDGITIALTIPAENGDTIEAVAYKAFNLTDATNSIGNFTVGQNLTVNGFISAGGTITGTEFYGDGSNLEGVASAGLGTAISDIPPGDVIYYTNTVLSIGSTVTVDPPATTNVAYTQYAEVAVEQDHDLIVADGDDFVPDILGLSSEGTGLLPGAGGRVRADNFTNKAGSGAPNFPSGLTATTGSFTGNVSIAGTLTYEDVTNVDSVGLITARSGLIVTAGVSTFGGNVLPDGDGTRDLGATGTRWANLYTSDIDLSNESKGGNEIDGTWGSYTIQEGEENLFLINRRSGKRYKFVLEEVD